MSRYNDSVDIGKLNISPPLFLAPMSGVTHSALRSVIANFGGIGLFSTEMLSARNLSVENVHLSPYLITTEREHPLSYQLFVGDPKDVLPAIAKIEELGADAVDLNLGCGAPRVRKKGGGISLSNDEPRLRAVVKEIRKSTNLPFTVKIRLGTRQDVEGLRKRVLMLEDMGVDGIYVHARFDRESFSRRPKWKWVRLVKEWCHLPVIANGGIFSPENAKRCLEESGADGLMIGRASAMTPWIFSKIASHVYGKGDACYDLDLPSIYLSFYTELVTRFPGDRQLGRLKEFTHYFSRNYPFGHILAMSVQRARTVQEAFDLAFTFFEKHGGTEKDGSLYGL